MNYDTVPPEVEDTLRNATKERLLTQSKAKLVFMLLKVVESVEKAEKDNQLEKKDLVIQLADIQQAHFENNQKLAQHGLDNAGLNNSISDLEDTIEELEATNKRISDNSQDRWSRLKSAAAALEMADAHKSELEERIRNRNLTIGQLQETIREQEADLKQAKEVWGGDRLQELTAKHKAQLGQMELDADSSRTQHTKSLAKLRDEISKYQQYLVTAEKEKALMEKIVLEGIYNRGKL